MKKFLKIFAIAAIAVAAAIACVFAGCGKDDDGDTSADYNFTLVYEDGSAVNGQTDGNIEGKVFTMICLPGDNGTCILLGSQAGIWPDANGKLSLSQSQVNTFFGSSTDVTEFIFHVQNVPGHKDDCTVTVNGKGNYSVTITVS